MYIELQGKELKKDWKALAKSAKEEDSNDKGIGEEERLLIDDEKDDILDLSFNKDDEKIYFAVCNKYGYFSFSIPLDNDLMFEIVDCLKSKGKEIERLIDLNK